MKPTKTFNGFKERVKRCFYYTEEIKCSHFETERFCYYARLDLHHPFVPHTLILACYDAYKKFGFRCHFVNSEKGLVLYVYYDI